MYWMKFLLHPVRLLHPVCLIDTTELKCCPPMHPYKLQIALSTKSTLLFIKRKKCSTLTKSKKRTMVLTIFFVSYSERKSDIPSLLLFWPSLLWMPIQAENAWEYYYYEYVWQRYTYRVLQTIQMNLIFLCGWTEPAVLGSVKTALKFKYEILIG